MRELNPYDFMRLYGVLAFWDDPAEDLYSFEDGEGVMDGLDSKMDDIVIQRWIIKRLPGCVPEVKRPLQNTHEGILTMVRELRALYSDATLMIVELAYGGQLWVKDADEEVVVGV